MERVLVSFVIACKESMAQFQKVIQLKAGRAKGKQGLKSVALARSLFVQEIEVVRTVEMLMACSSPEEACLLWAGKYQLR